jgi:hypothetical protein
MNIETLERAKVALCDQIVERDHIYWSSKPQSTESRCVDTFAPSNEVAVLN